MLRRTDRNAMLLEALKDESEMFEMFVFVCAGQEDVISIHEGEMESMKQLIHESLEFLSFSSRKTCEGIRIGRMAL